MKAKKHTVRHVEDIKGRPITAIKKSTGVCDSTTYVLNNTWTNTTTQHSFHLLRRIRYVREIYCISGRRLAAENRGWRLIA